MKEIPSDGKINVITSFHRITIVIANNYGDIVAWASTGLNNTDDIRKAVRTAADEYGIKRIDVRMKGPKRIKALEIIRDENVTINLIKDVTPIPHNGVRPPKQRKQPHTQQISD